MAAPLKVSWRWRDSEGDDRSEVMYVEAVDITDLADAETFVEEMAGFLQPLSDCWLLDAKVEFTFDVTGGSVTGAARNDAGATLSFENEVDVAFSMFIPGFKTSLMSNRIVSAAATAVNDFVQAVWLATGLTNAATITDRNGLNLGVFRGGKQSTRKK